jgi:hypothetical protein
MKKMGIRITGPVLITTIVLTVAWSLHIFTEEPQITPLRHSSLRREQAQSEQYPIYSAVLEHYVTNETKLLVIWNETSRDLSEEYPEDDLTEILPSMVSQDTIDDYTSRSKETKSLQDLFALSVRCRLIGPEEARQYSDDGFGWWDTFHKKNPLASGVITFSSIGYDEDLNQALVYVEYYCGSLCATGKYFSLEQKDGAWRIMHEHMRWIS